MALLLALLMLAPLWANPVQTRSGLVEGRQEGGVRIFLGIPYAAPPVGDLRWRPPQPPEKWSGVRAAREYSPACMQARPASFATSEDCLTLNIWTPAQAARLPVMVWIHGGAYANGSGALPLYDGARLAKNRVVVVTLNYRLNDFGFFAHPELSREQKGAMLGNYGLMDQIAALEWVKHNIAAFGGDPGNVTIFGESAGGGSVLCLMVSPVARGLFHRAAVQSGAGSTGSRTLAALEASGVKRAREWGAASLAGMRKLPARDIVAKPAPGGLTAHSPAVDGVLLTDSVASAFSRGTQAPAPLLIGANSWEASLMSGSPTGGVLDKMAGALREKVEAVYETEWPKAVQALFGDFVFVMPARRFAGQMEKVNRPAYLYHFSFVPGPLGEKTPGARHGAEIRYVFNNVTAGLGTALAGEEERRLGELMSAYWAEFARTGNPNGGDRPAWPAYTRASDRLLEFSGPRPAVRERFRAAQLDFAESLLNNPALGR